MNGDRVNTHLLPTLMIWIREMCLIYWIDRVVTWMFGWLLLLMYVLGAEWLLCMEVLHVS